VRTTPALSFRGWSLLPWTHAKHCQNERNGTGDGGQKGSGGAREMARGDGRGRTGGRAASAMTHRPNGCSGQRGKAALGGQTGLER